jgi:hypothetical protein
VESKYYICGCHIKDGECEYDTKFLIENDLDEKINDKTVLEWEFGFVTEEKEYGETVYSDGGWRHLSVDTLTQVSEKDYQVLKLYLFSEKYSEIKDMATPVVVSINKNKESVCG